MSTKVEHVLLTRPEGKNDTLLADLKSHNISARELPMMSIVLLDDPDQIVESKQQFTGVITPELDTGYKLDTTFDVALFTSANAVLSAARFCDQYNVGWPADLPCVGMGRASNDAIKEQGWTLLSPDDDEKESLTSEEMLETSWAMRVEGKRVLLVKGEMGRGLLVDRLRAGGALVEPVTLYRREPVSYNENERNAALESLKTDPESTIILFASGETLKNFCKLAKDGLAESLLPALRCMVPSMRVALEARELGFERIVISDGPGNKAVLRKLLELAS